MRHSGGEERDGTWRLWRRGCGAGPLQQELRAREGLDRHQDEYAGHGHAAERAGCQPAGAAGPAGHHLGDGAAERQRGHRYRRKLNRSQWCCKQRNLALAGFRRRPVTATGFVWTQTATGNDTFSSRQLANVSSVEVLKGPGAILYGLAEPGGVINLTTKEPLDAPITPCSSSSAPWRTIAPRSTPRVRSTPTSRCSIE